MGRGSAKGSSPNKKGTGKAPARRRAAPKRTAKAAKPRRTRSAKPKSEAARLASELKEALQRQAATADILKVIASSRSDVQPVFETIVVTAARLLRCDSSFIMRCDGAIYSAVAAATLDGLRPVLNPAPRPVDPAADFPSRAIASKKNLYLPDWSKIELPAFERMVEERRGLNSALYLPMLREDQCIGVLGLASRHVNNFAARDIALAESFRDQALIAIENARLFNETKEALEQQTATSEVLEVISSSPGDLAPVFSKMLENATRVCGANFGIMNLYDGEKFSIVADHNVPAAFAAYRQRTPIPPQPGTAHGEVVRTHQVVQIRDVRETPAYQSGVPFVVRMADVNGARTLMTVPMLKEDELLGTITIYRTEVRLFTDKQVALLENFTRQAVIAIENTRLLKETQEALQRQTATADILKVIASSPDDVQPVFDAIAVRANKLVGGHATAVLRVAGDMAELAAFTPVSEEADAVLRTAFPMPFAGNPLLEIVKGGEISEISDTESEIYAHSSIRNVARARGFRSRLLVPLKTDGGVIGAINVTRVEPGSFAGHHVQLLQTFADQAVIAIQNVRLFNETKEALERQTATADILKVIASSPDDVQPVFDAIVISAARLIGGFSAAVYRYVDGAVHLAAMTSVSPAADETLRASFPRPLADSYFAIAQSGEVVQIPDTEEDPDTRGRDLARARGVRSIVFVPLTSQGDAIGMIAVSRQIPGSFAAHHVGLLQTFADQAVIAIENVRLFNETKEALERQTATADVLKVIASSPSDVQPVFEAIVQAGLKLFPGSTVMIVLANDGTVRAAAIADADPRLAELLRNAFPSPLTRDYMHAVAMLDRRVVDVPDAKSGPAEFAAGLKLFLSTDHQAITIMPLLRGDEAIGALSVVRPQAGPLSNRQLELLKTFSDQAVIAIENTRLLRELRERTDDLQESLQQQTATSEVLRVISSSSGDLQPVFKVMLDNALKICEASYGNMLLWNADGFEAAELHNSPPAFAELFRGRRLVPPPATALGRVVTTKQVAHIPDITAETGGVEQTPLRVLTIESMRARTLLAVPMLRESELVGVIVIYRQEVRPFSEKQIELVTNFADQAVIAIENARLLNELRERTKELSQSLDDLRAAQDRLVQTEKLASLGQLTAGIAHEIKNPLNFVNNFSALSAELTDELNDLLKRAELTDKMRQEVDELTRLLKENLEKVEQHGKRADSIVKNMLLHSREGSGEQRSADINTLVDESLNFAYHGARAEKAGFNITLQRDFDAGAGSAELFPQEITRALLNLISNGFYAAARRNAENGDGGFEPTLLATTKNLGHAVEIRIRDNGTGIPPEVREKMFNPFFTTKPAGEGTGLGLSMTHDIIVKQHGGRIEVATELGQFTEFTIVLPRTGNSRKTR